MALYATLGRRVAVPYDGVAAAGEVVHVALGPRGAGVYVARLEVDGEPYRALRITVAR